MNEKIQGIPRPRLNALFDAAVREPLVIVYAGAGFGKTQAVAMYLAQTQYRSVWLPLSALDNIPARFWENFTAVAKRHKPALAEKMCQLGFPDTLQAFDTFLTEFTAELYKDDQFVVFVFDDLHWITEPLVKNFLYHFISARLENNSIVLITRQWPLLEKDIPVSAQIIGTDDLRFTLEETRQLFAAAGATVDRKEMAAIHRYVTGWPIALSTIALALRRHDREPIELAGTKPVLFALFEQEIFSQYTPLEQNLLIKLSVLDSFPRGLVHAVSGEKGRDLSQLLAANIFIKYDAQARRFYFHSLYHEFLREKLLSMKQEEVKDAYQKAADWCRANGHYYDAIAYYQQCGNLEDLWETILLFDATRHTQPEADFFIRQIEAMPEAFQQSHPMTQIVLAAMLLNNLRFSESKEILDSVQQKLENDGDAGQLLGECYVARGLFILGMEQNGFEEYFQKAAALLPGGSRRWGKSLRLVDLGPGLNLQGSKAGDLKKSLACFTEGVPYIVQVLHGAGQGLDKLCECEASFLTGDTKSAIGLAHHALYSAQDTGQYDIVGNALFMLMRLYIHSGDYNNLIDVLAQIEHYSKEEQTDALGIWDIAKGWFCAEIDLADQVAGWIRNATQYNRQPPISMDRVLLVQMRYLIASGREAEALVALEPFEARVKIKNAVITLLYIELGRAVIHNYLGDYGAAIGALKAAYTLAKGNKLFMPFIEYGNRTRSLLNRARETKGHGIPEKWLEQTHTKANTAAKRHAYLANRYRQEHAGKTPDFGLSKRETELLTNLSQGLTREEIGDSMQLSVNTVKSMLKQIFAKLGAVNSADAIRIAIVNKII